MFSFLQSIPFFKKSKTICQNSGNILLWYVNTAVTQVSHFQISETLLSWRTEILTIICAPCQDISVCRSVQSDQPM